ncbi:hypothetical protein ACU4GD_18710 [Cupriavidus basilensis]
MIAAFLVPIIVIILLVNFDRTRRQGRRGLHRYRGSRQLTASSRVASLELKDPNAARVFKTGRTGLQGSLAACHATGAAGAPSTALPPATGLRVSARASPAC